MVKPLALKMQIFRNKGWIFLISAQLVFDIKFRLNPSIFRNPIWCFFAKWEAELISKMTVARFPKADLVDECLRKNQSGSGEKL